MNTKKPNRMGLSGKAMLLTFRALSREAAFLYMEIAGDHTGTSGKPYYCTDSEVRASVSAEILERLTSLWWERSEAAEGPG